MPVWQSIACFATLYSVLISGLHIRKHCLHRDAKSVLVQCTIRILFVVPVYATCAFACVILVVEPHEWTVLITAVREVYEAIVLTSFVCLIVEIFGGAQALAGTMSEEEVPHLFLLRPFLRRRAPGSDFVGFVLIGILQYAFVMLVVLVADCFLWNWKVRVPAEVHDGLWDTINATTSALLGTVLPNDNVLQITEKLQDFDPFLIPKGIKMMSNGIAMYCLLLWYERLLGLEKTKDTMMRIRGVHKFLCIKFVVLLTLWQEAILKLLVRIDAISTQFVTPRTQDMSTDHWEPEEVGEAIVNILICLEMLLFAEWHRYAYSYKEGVEQSELCNEVSLERGPTYSTEAETTEAENSSFEQSREEDEEGANGCRMTWCTDLTGIQVMFRNIWTLRTAACSQRDAIRTLKELIRQGNGDVDDEKLRSAFAEFDADKYNHVTTAQLKFLLEEGGIIKSDSDLQFFLNKAESASRAKSRRSSRLNEDEFLEVLRGLVRSRVAVEMPEPMRPLLCSREA